MNDDTHLRLRAELHRPSHAISFAGFSRASVDICWLFNKDSQASHLVLAQATLIHDEVPCVDVALSWKERLGGKSSWTLSQESHPVSAAHAYEWFSTVVDTGCWEPTWSEPFDNAVPLMGRLSEPAWPGLVLLKDTSAVPLRNLSEGARGNHLFSTAGLLDELQEGERAKLYETILGRLGIDLKPIPETVQSVHFVQQSPIVRTVSSRLDTDADGADRAVLLDIVPRRGTKLDGVTIDVLETRGTGTRLLASGSVSSPFCRIDLEESVCPISVRLLHAEHGILREEGPYVFLKQIELNTQLMSDRRIELAARKGREAVVRRLPSRSSGEKMTVVGRERPASASQMLASVNQRLAKEAAGDKQQYWFRGEVAEAETAIHKILGSVRKLAMVVDPYFAARDVRPWLPFIQGGDIRVLTSSFGLRQQKSGAGEGVSKRALEANHLVALTEELKSAHSERLLGGEVAVRVMRGDKPPVHDRFIVVDEQAWLLGSSLNEFGTRGTMLVALPKPRGVIVELEKIWAQESEPLTVRLQYLTADKSSTP